MKPIIQYKCTECGKIYIDYKEAENCCCNIEELIELPSCITNLEDYVKMVIGIRKLESIDRYRYKDKIEKEKEKCLTYLDDIARGLLEQMSKKLNKYIVVDGIKYQVFDAADLISNYFEDEEYQSYDLVWQITPKE